MAAVEQDADVLLRAKILFGGDDGQDRYDWYLIKTNNNVRSDGPWDEIPLSPLFDREPNPKMKSGYAATGSTIYILGGGHLRNSIRARKFSSVYSIDVLHPEQGWKQGPSMVDERLYSYALTIDGKICVFGGGRSCPAEFLVVKAKDDEEDKSFSWQALPWQSEIEPNFDAHAVVTVDGETGKQLLFYSSMKGALYLYNFHSCRIVNNSLGTYLQCRPVFLDGIMYWYDNDDDSEIGFIYGLDVAASPSAPLKSSKQVIGLDRLPRFHIMALVRVGAKKLCMISGMGMRDKQYVVHCVKLKLSRMIDESGEEALVARILSSPEQLYSFRGDYFSDDCLALIPNQEIETPVDVCFKTPVITVENEGFSRSDTDQEEEKNDNKKPELEDEDLSDGWQDFGDGWLGRNVIGQDGKT